MPQILVYLELYPKNHSAASSGQWSNKSKLCLCQLIWFPKLDPQRSIERQSCQLLQLSRISFKCFQIEEKKGRK